MAAPAAAVGGGGSTGSKHTGEIFKQTLANVLEERTARIQSYVENGQAVARGELARFIWSTARKVFEVIAPAKDSDPKRVQAWRDAKGMLKELIDFDQFTHMQFHEPCIYNVLEKKVVDVLDAYRTYVMTGEIKTKHPPPKLLGETDEILCVDKPCMYTCSYGERSGKCPDRLLKHMGEKASASMLLNGEKAEIQLHEYLALKFNFENAVATREFWKNEPELMSCSCGKCPYCAATQSGCCNRLDKETSGVMIAAKSKLGFGEIRRQFESQHSLEEGGTEKYYLCLVHGELHLPAKPDERNKYWKHTLQKGRGRVEVHVVFDKEKWKALPYDDGTEKNGNHGDGKSNEGAQYALTYYEPVAWFDNKDGGEKFTLVHLQIITGRTHQIRFHMQQVGFPLVGDAHYGAPFSDRAWCPRVFLHSYQTKFREPFTDRWFEATSPLPQDLGEVVQNNLGKPFRLKEGAQFRSRRVHPDLTALLKQYDPNQPLLFSHDAPVNKDEVMRKVELQRLASEYAEKREIGPPAEITYNSKGYPVQEGRKMCTFFTQTGECRFGEKCVFSHPEGEVTMNSKGFPIRPGGLPCMFWMKHGDCKHGPTCHFTHPEDRSPMAFAKAQSLNATAKAASQARKVAIEEAKAGGATAWKAIAGADGWKAAGAGGGGGWQADSGGGGWKAAAAEEKGADAWKAAGEQGGDGWKAAEEKGADTWKAAEEKGADAWKADDSWKASTTEAAWKEDTGWQAKAWEKEEGKNGGGGEKWQAEAAAAAAPKQPEEKASPTKAGERAAKASSPPAHARVGGARVAAEPPAKRPRVAEEQGSAPATPPGGGPPGAEEKEGQAAGQPESPWKRMESRSQPGAYYYWNQTTGATQAEPPAPWEKRKSRSQATVFYYWNPATGASSAQKPEV